jgi:cell division septum initiation protein DivIVA
VDVHDKIDELTHVIESARSMPMSASCIVHRGEVLGLIDELRDLLPDEVSHARTLLEDRDAVLEEGHREGQRIIDEAYAERARLVAEAEIVAQAREEAERLRTEVTHESERLRAETAEETARMREEVDEYVDARLASFEVTLDKTLTAVHRGRAKLAGRRAEDGHGTVEDPDELGGQSVHD